MKRIHERLTQFINKLADISGHPWLFVAAIVLIIAWFVVGIFFRYDSTWYDIMDVFVFLCTFFLVFIVQSSQNADMQAIQDKLDELIDSAKSASESVQSEEKKIKSGKKKSR